MTIALSLAVSDSPLPLPPQHPEDRGQPQGVAPTDGWDVGAGPHSASSGQARACPSQLPQPRTRNSKLPPSLSSDNGCPVSLAHHTAKDKIWVRQANAAACGSLLASNRRLRQHLHSLPPDSPEALAIQSFLQFGI